MINSVRNTVLVILNKNNYGYLSPSDFNLYAKQAQMEIFEDYFYQYNYQINKENVRQSGTELADISKIYKEVIEGFIVPATVLTQDTGNTYNAPSVITTGSDAHTILNVYCYDTTTTPKTYVGEAEKADNTRINAMLRSNLTAPSRMFPAYVLRGTKVVVYPDSFNTPSAVEAQYIRYPKDPKWTFVSLVGGSPSFDQSAADYQDFELPADDEYSLVVKICELAGVTIREQEVQAFARQAELIDNQSKQ